MKKSELKQVISEIVRRKMGEKTSSYGYVMKPMAGDDPSDPRLQLIGYGNMGKSFAKKISKMEMVHFWNILVVQNSKNTERIFFDFMIL